MLDDGLSGGTGRRLAGAAVIIAGVCSLVASLLSVVSVWLQTKNYRKPLLQRYVVRILLMVPIYSISSWCSLVSLKLASFIDPVRDIYEAFTIYTFFQLLINFLGGERALIIMMHGRKPVRHLWPLNHCLPPVDISDPHTFLAIKRGILQYAWLKPILGLASIIMRSTEVFQEGYISLSSGYLWSGIVYNISVTLSLYSLAMFWVCMSKDLQPFRPMPKFLCIKLIIFASYWQGFFLSILVFLGAIPDDVTGYTSDNLAAAIQDALICFEMPLFAIAHWYAFSWHDYADVTISAARMPVLYAIRDAFGVKDLIEDTKETFSGNTYEYRQFDSGDNIIAHEGSSSRVARMMEGMRYERGGKGKYWIPKPGEVNTRTPLLSSAGSPSRLRSTSPFKPSQFMGYSDGAFEEDKLEPDVEHLYEKARKLTFGDWNYPVITAHEVSREAWLTRQPSLLTTSTNRNLPQSTKNNKVARESYKSVTGNLQNKGKDRDSSSDGEEGCTPVLEGMPRHHFCRPSAAKSDNGQSVNLVEDEVAEVIEGSADWNEVEPRRFLHTYSQSEGEYIQRFETNDSPASVDPKSQKEIESTVGKDGHDGISPGAEEAQAWKQSESKVLLKPKYSAEKEILENVWGGGGPSPEHPKGHP